MTDRNAAIGKLDDLPRARFISQSTPIEEMPILGEALDSSGLFVKRDDMTGLAFGGNKVRQLEFYLGEAVSEGADTVLITGAVQSNFVRMAAAAARKCNMQCHIQLEERVPKNDPVYRLSGNVLVDRLLGATLHSYDKGEDEAGADRRLHDIAEGLKGDGRHPYIIHLAPGHAPLGALGYVDAAREILSQCAQADIELDEIVVASGSGHTHAGLLFGLRALGSDIPVTGICVRRPVEDQTPRLIARCSEIAALLDMDNPVSEEDVVVDDSHLAPGYGRASQQVLAAMQLAAHKEALILDPVYTAKAMAGFIDRVGSLDKDSEVLFVHTGGTPAIFAYEKDLDSVLQPG
jgi:D-cysteine desulfhydrase/L-cysteate sulfo-lyase